MLRIALPAACCLLVGLLLGGCGSDRVKRANAYVDGVNRAESRFADSSDQLLKRITPTSTPSQDRATLARFSSAVDRVVADLRAVSPPDRVRTLHTRLVGQIARLGTEVDRARSALSSKDASKIARVPTQLSDATSEVSREINTTTAAINRALKAK